MKKALKVIGVAVLVVFTVALGTYTVLKAKIEEEEKMFKANY